MADPRQPAEPVAVRWGELAAGMAEQAFELLREYPLDEDAERRATALSLTAIAMTVTKEAAARPPGGPR